MLEENTQVGWEEFVDVDEFKILSLLLRNGGEPATEWFADAVQHFIHCKYARAPASSIVANEDCIPDEI